MMKAELRWKLVLFCNFFPPVLTTETAVIETAETWMGLKKSGTEPQAGKMPGSSQDRTEKGQQKSLEGGNCDHQVGPGAEDKFKEGLKRTSGGPYEYESRFRKK